MNNLQDRFKIGKIVKSKKSGKLFKIDTDLRSDFSAGSELESNYFYASSDGLSFQLYCDEVEIIGENEEMNNNSPEQMVIDRLISARRKCIETGTLEFTNTRTEFMEGLINAVLGNHDYTYNFNELRPKTFERMKDYLAHLGIRYEVITPNQMDNDYIITIRISSLNAFLDAKIKQMPIEA